MFKSVFQSITVVIAFLGYSFCFPVCSAASGDDSGYDSGQLVKNASDFLFSKWGKVVRKIKTGSAGTPAKITKQSDAGGLTVVNICSGNRAGYVLYAGNTPDAPMVGYGLADTLSLRGLPPTAADFIESYKAAAERSTAMKRAASTQQDIPTYPDSETEPVEAFIKTKWGQEEPFNALCPLNTGKRSVTGCDAVAVSQVLHYFKARNFNDFLLEYADDRSMAEISIRFSELDFDYDNMQDVYENGKYTDAQANAVAEIMYAAGAACKMKWGTETSSGQWPLVALDKYFNMNASFLIREQIPTRYWMKKIIENLSARKPILYSGKGVSSSKYVGHIFVLDGIDENNFIHVNWGWAGVADGYYDITFCHPDILDDKEDGYYKDQMMICDISPRSNGESYQEHNIVTSSTSMALLNSGSLLEGAVIGCTTNSYDSNRSLGDRLVAVESASGDKIPLSVTSKSVVFPDWGTTRWSVTTNFERGEYEIMLESVNMDTEEVTAISSVPMRPYFTVDDSGITEYGYKDFPEGKTPNQETEELSLNSFTPMTDVIAKAPFFVRIDTRSLLNSVRSAYAKRARLCFTSLDTQKKYYTTKDVVLYDLAYYGLDYSTVVEIEPPVSPDNGFMMPGGRYSVCVTSTNNSTEPDPGVVYPEPIILEVADQVDYPVLKYDIDGTLMLSSWNYGTNYSKKWGDRVTFRTNANFKGVFTANNCYNPVEMLLLARPVSAPESEEIILSTFSFDPAAMFGSDAELAGLYPLEGEYMFYLRYLTPDGVRDILPLAWNWRDKETGLTARPTCYNIAANKSARVPMIEISDVTAEVGSCTFTAKNISAYPFSGNVYLTAYNSDRAELLKVPSDAVTLAAGESIDLNLNVDFMENTYYDMYFHAQASAQSRSRLTDLTLATKDDGSVAHFAVGDLSASEIVNSVTDTRIRVIGGSGMIRIYGSSPDSTVDIYSFDGRLLRSETGEKVTGIAPGIYIVRVGGHSVKAIVK